MARKKHSLLKTLLTLNLCAFAGMYAVNQYIKKTTISKSTPADKNSFYYSWKHGKIYYTVSGVGEKNILLLHDTKSYASSSEWKDLIAKLSDEYTVYAIDLLGCGRSDKPQMAYTNYLYVQLIQDFIKDVIDGQTEITASGLSASIATMAAFSNPDKILSLTFIHPTSRSELQMVPDSKSKFLYYVMNVPVLGTFLYNLLSSQTNLEKEISDTLFVNSAAKYKLIKTAYEDAHRGFGKGRFLRACLDGRYVNWNIDRAISLMTQPVSILYGESDVQGKITAKDYRSINAQIRLHAVENSKALPHLENPEETAKLLKNTANKNI